MSVKLLTSGGGGVVLTPSSSIASDQTMYLPVSGVSGGTVVCSDSNGTTTLNSASGYSPLVAKMNGTEYMRLDSSGNLLVGQTASSGAVKQEISFAPSSQIGVRFNMTDTTYNNAVMEFRTNTGTRVGFIYANGSSTTYSTSSDYRLKEDIQSVATPIDRLNELKPINFAWKADGSRCDGFLAHELQAIIPEAATGTKDEVDADGNPVYQGIDQSKIVPLLVASVQALIGQVNELKAEVMALKGDK